MDLMQQVFLLPTSSLLFDYFIPFSFDSRFSLLFVRSLLCIYCTYLYSGMNRRASEWPSLISYSHIVWHPPTSLLASILGITLYMVPLHPFGCTPLVMIHMPAQQWVPSPPPLHFCFFSTVVTALWLEHLSQWCKYHVNRPLHDFICLDTNREPHAWVQQSLILTSRR